MLLLCRWCNTAVKSPLKVSGGRILAAWPFALYLNFLLALHQPLYSPLLIGRSSQPSSPQQLTSNNSPPGKGNSLGLGPSRVPSDGRREGPADAPQGYRGSPMFEALLTEHKMMMMMHRCLVFKYIRWVFQCTASVWSRILFTFIQQSKCAFCISSLPAFFAGCTTILHSLHANFFRYV